MTKAMHRKTQKERPIRLGLIGCGSIAQDSHLPAIRKIPQLIDLVAVADTDESKAKATGQDYRVSSVYTDYRRLLMNDQVEAVDICTPTKYHAEITAAAADSGKHVLCEKPIALTLEDADLMIKACEKNKVKLMIAHSRRFIPRYSIMKKIIEKGQIGKPTWAMQMSRRHKLDPNRYTWYFDPKMTYGPIAEVGIHEADLLRWFFDDTVAEVKAVARSRTPDAPLYDQVFTSLKFRRGGIASFEVGYVLPKRFQQFTTLEVLGSKGHISASDSHMNTVIQASDTGAEYPRAFSDLLSVSSAYEKEVIAFAESIIEEIDPPVTGSDARPALEIILAALQSIERKSPVKLPLKKGS